MIYMSDPLMSQPDEPRGTPSRPRNPRLLVLGVLSVLVTLLAVASWIWVLPRWVRPTPVPVISTPPVKVDISFVPTPQDIVEKMLEMAAVEKDDLLCDLGCGDGRIVLTAAKRYGCRADGYDKDPRLVRYARRMAQYERLDDLVTIHERDIFEVDLTRYSVVAMFLSPEVLQRLIPQFRQLKPGSRIVSHVFGIPGARVSRQIDPGSSEDGTTHTIFYYTTPLEIESTEPEEAGQESTAPEQE